MSEDNKPAEPTAGPRNEQPKSAPLPVPETKPLAGKIEAEKFGYASELLAYKVVDNLAGIVAGKVDVRLGPDVRVLLVTDLEHALDGLVLSEIREQISALRGVFSEREEKNRRLLGGSERAEERTEGVHEIMQEVAPVALATGVASLMASVRSAVGLAADVSGYLRTSYKIANQDFEVREQALLSSVAGALASRNIKGFIPGFHAAGESELLRDIADLGWRAVRLEAQKEALASQLPKPDKGGAAGGQQSSGETEHLAEVAAAVRETDAALTFFKVLRELWAGAKEAGEDRSKLSRALAREQVEKLDVTHLLWLGNLSNGGEATVRDRLVREDSVGFMGGAVVSFILAHPDGEVLAADTLSQFATFGQRISDYTGGEEGQAVRYVPSYR